MLERCALGIEADSFFEMLFQHSAKPKNNKNDLLNQKTISEKPDGEKNYKAICMGNEPKCQKY